MTPEVFTQQLKTINGKAYDAVIYTQEMQNLQQAYIQSGIQAVYQDAPDHLHEILKSHRKLRKAIAGLKKSETEAFLYECGIFNGAYKIFEELRQLYLEQEKKRDLQQLLDRKHVYEILDYLFQNPNARQGKIAEDVGIAPNYLSEILKSLLSADYIQRYGQHKGTRYCLTKAGRQVYRTHTLQKKKNNNTPIWINDFIIDEKEFELKEKFLKEKACETIESSAKKGDGNAKWGFDFQDTVGIKDHRRELGEPFPGKGKKK